MNIKHRQRQSYRNMHTIMTSDKQAKHVNTHSRSDERLSVRGYEVRIFVMDCMFG